MIYINGLTVLTSLVGQARDTIATAIAAVQHLISQESISPWFIEVEVEDNNDYEDYWTETRALYLASVAFPPTERVSLKASKYPFIRLTTVTEPAKIQQLPVLEASTEEAWDTVEKYLFDNEDYESSIVAITRAK